MGMTEIITDTEIYRRVILEQIPSAKKFVWLGTSDLKNMHVRKNRMMVPFLEMLSDLVKRKISIRLIHAREPGGRFRKDFDRFPNLIKGMERILCPRVHFKSVVVDGRLAYTGSANLTGAGMGAKSVTRRNFEAGIITTDKKLIGKIMKQFDDVWIGRHCKKCERKEYCADYKDILQS